MFNYSTGTLLSLVLMILTRAARAFVIKMYFQVGFDDPILVVFLYSLAFALGLPLHWVLGLFSHKDDESGSTEAVDEMPQKKTLPDEDQENDPECPEAPPSVHHHSQRHARRAFRRSDTFDMDEDLRQEEEKEQETEESLEQQEDQDEHQQKKSPHDRTFDRLDTFVASKFIGSSTGLNDRSIEAAQWVHRVPWWAKPLLSSFFNLVSICLFVLATKFLDATILTMLGGGLAILFTTLASRFVRKREVSMQRWLGSGVMTIGLLLIAGSSFLKTNGNDDDDEGESSEYLLLGLFCVIVSVCLVEPALDMSQEMFLQEAEFPPFLLLGMEGIYSIIMTVPVYFAFGPNMGYNPLESFAMIGESTLNICMTISLIVVVFLAGVYATIGTAATSAMTRNMWRNLAGLVVWVMMLFTYYFIDENLGEPWAIPSSFIVLLGYSIMIGGVYIYYRE